jgi:divalent metal cation (Fe/Co/Zn/Cd) transporter
VASSSTVTTGGTRRAGARRWIGHELRAEAEITSDAGMSLLDAHGVAHHAGEELLDSVSRLTSALIHTSPDGDAGHMKSSRNSDCIQTP